MGVIFTQCPFKDELITSSVVTASDYLLYSCDPRDLQPKSQQSKTCCISSCVCRNKMHDIILFSVKIEKKDIASALRYTLMTFLAKKCILIS